MKTKRTIEESKIPKTTNGSNEIKGDARKFPRSCGYVTGIVRKGANVHIYRQTFIMTDFDGKCA
jgi:hypothetical protein